jgi:hypothetical protein
MKLIEFPSPTENHFRKTDWVTLREDIIAFYLDVSEVMITARSTCRR